MQSPVLIVFRNKIFLTTIMAWAIAQCMKIILALLWTRKFNFKLFLGTGGMPSSHAAAVSALVFAIGNTVGFDSPICIATLIFALITMFDAQGVRRAAGTQAAILNKMVDDIYRKEGIKPERLKELLGHTPIEVFAGAFLGILIASICYR